MGKRQNLSRIRWWLSGIFLISAFANAAAAVETSWQTSLEAKLKELDANLPNQLGVFIKDITTGQEFSFHGHEPWYLASGVKVPIAIAVMKQIDEGKLSLDARIRLKESDYVDGAGATNHKKPGSHLSVRFLIDQMLIHSDNTATDLLIRRIGLEQVNALAGAEGFSRITTLADVRRLAYSGFHEKAIMLQGPDLLLLRQARNEPKRLALLSRLLGIGPGELRSSSFDSVFSAYYALGLNTAPLSTYGRLLEKLAKGRLLSATSTRHLLATLTKARTGRGRIIAGLPPKAVFAHKTGTQHGRICDFGIAWPTQKLQSKGVIIAACVRNSKTPAHAERLLKNVGLALSASGIL